MNFLLPAYLSLVPIERHSAQDVLVVSRADLFHSAQRRLRADDLHPLGQTEFARLLERCRLVGAKVVHHQHVWLGRHDPGEIRGEVSRAQRSIDIADMLRTHLLALPDPAFEQALSPSIVRCDGKPLLAEFREGVFRCRERGRVWDHHKSESILIQIGSQHHVRLAIGHVNDLVLSGELIDGKRNGAGE